MSTLPNHESGATPDATLSVAMESQGDLQAAMDELTRREVQGYLGATIGEVTLRDETDRPDVKAATRRDHVGDASHPRVVGGALEVTIGYDRRAQGDITRRVTTVEIDDNNRPFSEALIAHLGAQGNRNIIWRTLSETE